MVLLKKRNDIAYFLSENLTRDKYLEHNNNYSFYIWALVIRYTEITGAVHLIRVG